MINLEWLGQDNQGHRQVCYSYKEVVSCILTDSMSGDGLIEDNTKSYISHLTQLIESKLNDLKATGNLKTLLKNQDPALLELSKTLKSPKPLENIDSTILVHNDKVYFVEGEEYHSDSFYARLMLCDKLHQSSASISSDGLDGKVTYNLVSDDKVHLIVLEGLSSEELEVWVNKVETEEPKEEKPVRKKSTKKVTK